MAEPRRTSIPILHTRGTFYEVGYDVVSLLNAQCTLQWGKCVIYALSLQNEDSFNL